MRNAIQKKRDTESLQIIFGSLALRDYENGKNLVNSAASMTLRIASGIFYLISTA
jgi:hypothetical protein